MCGILPNGVIKRQLLAIVVLKIDNNGVIIGLKVPLYDIEAGPKIIVKQGDLSFSHDYSLWQETF